MLRFFFFSFSLQLQNVLRGNKLSPAPAPKEVAVRIDYEIARADAVKHRETGGQMCRLDVRPVRFTSIKAPHVLLFLLSIT